MHFDELFLRKLCADKVDGAFPPFKSKNIDTVERYIKGIVGRLNDCKSLIVKADFTSYGSGFASYIPIRISKKDRSDTIIQKKGDVTTEEVNALELYVSNFLAISLPTDISLFKILKKMMTRLQLMTFCLAMTSTLIAQTTLKSTVSRT